MKGNDTVISEAPQEMGNDQVWGAKCKHIFCP